LAIDEAALDAKAETLRELIREANGTLSDIRAERRATEKLIQDFRADTAARMEAVVEEAVRDGLENLGKSIDTAIGNATQAVYNRFDVIAGICLGEDAVARDEGKPSTETLVRRYVAEKGLRFP
jgi:hypothetical protein